MLNIIGTIFGTSGYDCHCRELANALNKLTECTLTVPVMPNWQRFCNDDEMKMMKRIPDDDINLIITTPIHWKMYTSAKRNWAYLVWEGDKIPASWIEECLNPDIEYIFVPSEHTKKAIIETWDTRGGAKLAGENIIKPDFFSKIKIIPHGVDLKKFYHKPQKYGIHSSGKRVLVDDKNFEKRFTFLANKGFRHLQDRGGIQYLIQAYLEEFTKEDNVELVLKINPAYPFNPEILKNFKGDNKIVVNAENIEYNKLVNLYNQCDVFVSPCRAEAFNIPCLEAMACGKPVITTDFGGQTDYCTAETGWIITGELEEVKFDVSYEGIKWLTPNIEELKKSLRFAYENPGIVKQMQEHCINTAKTLAWENTAKLILNLK